MIKMYIDNEEVLSNKELTIKEEMLNTSSTILNNVYPKSWENTKNYTNNFYYPKDYSKCKIIQGDFEKGEEEYSILTSNEIFETNVEKDFYSLDVYGDSKQKTYSGKNLIKYDATSTTINGITLTINKDQSITLNGKATAETTLHLITSNKLENYTGQIFTFSCTGLLNGVQIALTNSSWENTQILSYNDNIKTFTLINNIRYYWISVQNGTTLNNVIIYPQIELGTQATSWEPYVGGIPSPNPDYPQEIEVVEGIRNLLDNNIESQTLNGLTITKNADKTLTINGTPTGKVSLVFVNNDLTLEKGTYTLSGCPSSGSDTTYKLDANIGSNYYKEWGTGVTFTLDSETTLTRVRLIINIGSAFNNVIIKPMITKGSILHTYIPYGSNYLINKITGKNLFDKDNYVLANGYYNDSGNIIIETNWRHLETPIEIKSNTKYILNSILYASGSGRIIYFDKNLNFISRSEPISVSNTPFKFTTPSNARYIKWNISGTYFNANTTQLEEGSTATDYEQYKETIINYDLSKTNLFDKNNAVMLDGLVPNNSGKIVSGTTTGDNFQKTLVVSCKPNTTYSISKLSSKSFYVFGSAEFPTLNYQTSVIYNSGSLIGDLTFKTPANSNYIVFKFYNTWAEEIYSYQQILDSIKIYNGSITPYWDLCKIGDIKDEIDEVSGLLTKRIKKIVLDGVNYKFKSKVGGAGNIFILPIGDLHSVTTRTEKTNAISTHFQSLSYNDLGANDTGMAEYPNSKQIRCKFGNNSTITTLALANEFLQNNNVELYYIENEEETVQLSKMKTSPFIGYNDMIIESKYFNPNILISYYYKNADLLFSGIVENTGNISLRPEDAKFCSLQILDFKTLLSEGDTLDYVIDNKTIEEAIEMVIDSCSEYGVEKGNINILNGDTLISAYSTLDKTPYDVFQYIADITQSRWTTRVINEDTIAIDFYDPTLMPRGENIEYTKEWFDLHQIMDLSFNYSSRDYRNKQIMTSNKIYADISYTEVLRSDGYNTSYTLSQEIGTIENILVNGEERTFTTNDNKELGESADFYYSIESNTLTSGEVIAGGSNIVVQYIPLVLGRQVISNTNEIQRVNTNLNRKGTISRYENRNDAVSSYELQKIGQSYIKYKGTPEVNVKVQTQDNIWNVGNIVYFDAPLEELKQEYMVKSKETKIITSVNKVFYTYVLTSSFNSENEINYFDNQRNKSKGNIQEGNFINRNIDIEDEANIIFYDLVIEEV